MVGKLPFSGKMSIAPSIFKFYNSTNSTDRKKAYSTLALLLIAFVFFHGIQAQMGIKGLSYQAPLIVKVLFGLYATVNICVTVTQFYLLARSTYFLLTSKTYPRAERKWKEHTDKAKIWMLIVTLGGQAVFLTCYMCYS